MFFVNYSFWMVRKTNIYSEICSESYSTHFYFVKILIS